jgi:uncharacterized protein YndB with AHSA1/START domain
VTVAAPAARVWRALCEPAEVARWDGAQPVLVPAGYPQPGQHARWRVGRRLLHDRVLEVDPPRRLRARITYGLVDIDETYDVVDAGPSSVTVTSTNLVRSRFPGLSGWAARRLAGSVDGALRRLAEHCEKEPGPRSAGRRPSG